MRGIGLKKRPKERLNKVCKNGKTPSRNDRKVILSYGLNPNNWFVSKRTNEELHLIHKYVGQLKKIPNLIMKGLVSNGR
ncbi:DUF6906 family protein [Bacillus cereus]|uniref:DUF6906 family protein n=1 Tax=Bacillus toyonensis TaxID=155322 RepID=UPI00027BEAA1|nr:hypothetical protein IEA_05654 [Bacillus toyonensis]